jgi:hypothetical protein
MPVGEPRLRSPRAARLQDSPQTGAPHRPAPGAASERIATAIASAMAASVGAQTPEAKLRMDAAQELHQIGILQCARMQRCSLIDLVVCPLCPFSPSLLLTVPRCHFQLPAAFVPATRSRPGLASVHPDFEGWGSADRRPDAAAPGGPALLRQDAHERAYDAAGRALARRPASLAIGTRASRRSTLAIFGWGPRFRPRHFLRGACSELLAARVIVPGGRMVPVMTVSVLLKSCAMPPVSCPSSSIFCDCRSF